MVIVAGHVTVEPQRRESYLAGCVSFVEQARGAVGLAPRSPGWNQTKVFLAERVRATLNCQLFWRQAVRSGVSVSHTESVFLEEKLFDRTYAHDTKAIADRHWSCCRPTDGRMISATVGVGER